MGSTSDMAHCDKIRKACGSYGVPCVLRVTSAHKGPDETLRIKAEYEGVSSASLYRKRINMVPVTPLHSGPSAAAPSVLQAFLGILLIVFDFLFFIIVVSVHLFSKVLGVINHSPASVSCKKCTLCT